MSGSTHLKRKQDDLDTGIPDQLNKRPALDIEQLEKDDPATEDGGQTTGPVSKHLYDSSYVNLRMYCEVKEASLIVGKKGETINHIKEKANISINVSENLKGVPERIVLVRGSAENVAKGFGLISRTILEEPEDEPALAKSQQYNLKVLIPHPLVGYIIGKLGTKFREIEESSAAKLKAAEQPLPFLTDRILSVTGVGDAIHIAIYYISLVILDHKDCLKKHKVVYYNPANYRLHPAQNHMMSIVPPTLAAHPQNPLTMQSAQPGLMNHLPQMPKQPYDFQMMFQPTAYPQYPLAPQQQPALPVPQQTPYTDEHGNTLIGDVITNPPVPVGTSNDKFNEDVYVSNINIGSVIGKGGNNIKLIRESSGCTYVRIEPDLNLQILLGSKGLTNIRKLTLTGSLQAIHTAIYLINQRILADKERNQR